MFLESVEMIPAPQRLRSTLSCLTNARGLARIVYPRIFHFDMPVFCHLCPSSERRGDKSSSRTPTRFFATRVNLRSQVELS
ncbi:MAG: hypothetical protein JWM11_7647 [Planctomycetaceae bacterium]|nr:hypothetical protein [Planctomycetaceae bacterium]